MRKVAEGNLDVSVEEKSDNDRLAISVNRMTRSLKETSEENERNNWFKTGQAQLADQMRGNKDIPTLSRDIISCLAKYLNIQVGTFYVADREKILRLAGSYAFTKRKGIVTKIKHGEGLVGEVALEKQSILISDVPEDYMRVDSSLGNALPRNILAVPVILQGAVMGVMELGSLRPFTDRQMEFVELVTENIAIAINTAKESRRTKVLLEETQSQAEELQAQQEELKVSNEQLQAQQEELKVSNEGLQTQQEELRVSNEGLGNKTRVLESQKEEIEKSNRSLALAKEDLTKKARELAVSSKYKSEFLANMSHELRTPLNSLLILSRDLAENSSGNLTEEQVESAKIVHNSGQGLLSLINDILDLSKIEAGKMQVSFANIKLDEIEKNILTNFRHVLDKKNLALTINLSREIRPEIQTDQQKLEQIIKNLISNSIKFTESGGITVDFGRVESHVDLSRSGLKPEDTIAISVIDTGIGIPEDKQLEIFEAFQQADGSISRQYGGTGLGLSISRELVNLLGGEIKLKSEVGKGSTFTIYLPFVCKKTVGHQEEKRAEKQKKREKPEEQKRLINPQTFSSIPDDRDELEAGDKVILIIEDDPVFAKSVQDQAGGHRFKTLVSATGEEGVELARKHIPEAVVLDINLPGIDGWAVLDTLKDDPDLRHIPVHIVSSENENLDAYKKGAIEYLEKPVSREQLSATFQQIESFNEKRVKDLLLVEDDENMRKSIIKLIGNSDVATTEAATGDAAIAALETRVFDCMVLDLRLPDITGTELLQKMNDDNKIKIPPVIIYTGKDLTSQEVEELQQYSDSIIIKGAKSEERLLDETALFLHRVVKNMPGNQQKMIARLHDKEQIFRNQKVLLVDDDMRNVFALSKVLNKKGIKVEKAENGKKALAVLEKEDDIGLVLMDIMMPVMDGYETIERIRSQQKFNELPIIALTAKAMASDREKCVAVGANDYISKPVDVDRLLSLMRIWLYRDPLS